MKNLHFLQKKSQKKRNKNITLGYKSGRRKHEIKTERKIEPLKVILEKRKSD